MLAAEGLKLSFRDADGRSLSVLDIPNFAPPPSGLTIVRGPSGSGKSSLLYVLAGLLPPDAGTINIDGVDIYALNESRRDAFRRERIGFVFQDFHLLPELLPVANVAIAGTFARSGRDLKRRALSLLDRLEVPTSRRSVDLLSRGERQRVAIARALLFDPPLILADEPTASLDDRSAAKVLGVFDGLAQSGKTVVMASHDPSAIAMADLAVTLQRGLRLETEQAAA